MPIAKITGQGLAAIALSVTLLWACLIGERVIKGQAIEDRNQVMREVRLLRLKRQAEPASAPMRNGSDRVRVHQG